MNNNIQVLKTTLSIMVRQLIKCHQVNELLKSRTSVNKFSTKITISLYKKDNSGKYVIYIDEEHFDYPNKVIDEVYMLVNKYIKNINNN